MKNIQNQLSIWSCKCLCK